MFRFETLDIWKDFISYFEEITEIVDGLPKNLQYNLGEQLRRSVLSISNNIAEGSGSSSKLDFRKFLNYSIRSAFETVSMLIIAQRKKYISQDKFSHLYTTGETLVKKISSFRNKL